MISVMKHKKIWFAVSLALLIPGVLSIIFWGLKLGIDFTGGSLIELSGVKEVAQIEEPAKTEGVNIKSTQRTGDSNLIVRTENVSEEQHRKFVENVQKQEGVKEVRFETVGATVSSELTLKAFYSIAIASFLIILYLAYSFRKVPKPVSSWEFGIAAVIALIHDVLVMLGFFSILGHFFHIEIDSMFVTAALTIIGFSVHDTIVVFDRIRENLIKKGADDFEEICDQSIFETIARSINTSFTTFIVLLALFLLGGSTTQTFVLALLIGIVSGTYSSIFTATPLLGVWQQIKGKGLRSLIGKALT